MKYPEQLRKCQFLLIIAFGSLPLPFLLFAAHGTGLLPYGWIFPAVYAVSAVLCLGIRGKWRLPFGITLVLLLLALCMLAAPRGLWTVAMIASLFYGVLLLWSLKIASWEQNEEIPVSIVGSGFAAQLIGQIAFHLNRTTGDGILAPYGPVMKLSFFAFILLTMLSMNRNGLILASEKRQRVSGLMRQKNFFLTLGLFVSALLISLVPSAFRLLKALLVWMMELVVKLILLFSRPGQGGDAAAGGNQSMMAMPEGAEPSRLALLLERIMIFAGGALVLGLLAYCVYRLAGILSAYFRKLWKMLERYASAVSEDYEDEITDTREFGSSERMRRKVENRRLSAYDTRKMTPGQRIRYRYLRLTMKHPEWKTGSTARENLPLHIASLYERARYSDHPVTEEDAAQFMSESRRL